MTSFARPRPVSPVDDVSAFHSGVPVLDSWLHLRAIKNQRAGNSRTFVSVHRESGRIAGYYCLSAHAVAHDDVPGALRRNSPDPIPVILLGRLAVDEQFRGLGLGASLLADAVAKGLEAADLIGSRAFLVDALSDEAVTFYERFGFRLMPESSRALYVTMADARATIAGLPLD